LQKAWRSELLRNPNATTRSFIDERRVQNFFSQEGGETQTRFIKNADSMKVRISQHKRDCEKTARMFRSQGYYPWADAWDRYGKNPEGPYPECTHQQLKDEMFRLKNAKGDDLGYDDHAYQKFMNRGCSQSGSGYIEGPVSRGGGIKATKPEMTNAELGTILSGNCNLLQKGRSCHCGGKGHPEQLISKIKKSKQENPSFYKKDTGY